MFRMIRMSCLHLVMLPFKNSCASLSCLLIESLSSYGACFKDFQSVYLGDLCHHCGSTSTHSMLSSQGVHLQIQHIYIQAWWNLLVSLCQCPFQLQEYVLIVLQYAAYFRLKMSILGYVQYILIAQSASRVGYFEHFPLDTLSSITGVVALA